MSFAGYESSIASLRDSVSIGSGSESRNLETIVYGAFKGMGDLLNAAPVIASLLDSGHLVKLLIFPSGALDEFIQLLNFGPNKRNLEFVYLPVSGRVRDLKAFFSQMARIRPDLVWISPHAPRQASSWKIPLLLWLTTKLLWRQTTFAGAVSERLSSLFDMRVSVDRDLPMMQREWAAFSNLRELPNHSFQTLTFVDRIQKLRGEPAKYDLLIHPGATALNRSWPSAHYQTVVRLIPRACRVAVLGLAHEVELLRRCLPSDRGIEFLTGTLEEAISAIAQARLVFCMDSGAAHFAQFLNVPAVALFGKSDPATIINRNGSVVPIYQRNFPCQPCGRAVCNQPEIYCMNRISPERVANVLQTLLTSDTKNNI